MQTVKERIKQLRSFLLVHSFLYYKLNESIVSDSLYDQASKELAEVQQHHPEDVKIDWYDNLFDGWDGSTGFHLAYDPFIQAKAEWLLKYYNNM